MFSKQNLIRKQRQCGVPIAAVPELPKESPLDNAKIYDYRKKYSSDYVVAGFNNQVLVNRFQPYAGGAGPIYLSNAMY
jgi:hypothetical protein